MVYVKKSTKVKPNDPEIQKDEASESRTYAIPSPIKYMVTSIGGLWLREEPSRSSKGILTMPEKTIVDVEPGLTITSPNGEEFVKVKYKDFEGWSMKLFLKEV